MPLCQLTSRLAQILLARFSLTHCVRRRYNTVQIVSNGAEQASSTSLTASVRVRSRSPPSGGSMHQELLLPLTCQLASQGSDSGTAITFDDIRRIEILSSDKMNSENRLMTVMSYNVLAQDLIAMHRNLYAKHSPEALDWEYRKQLLMQQILLTNPDVLSLQEVQESHIGSFYSNLEGYGYKGVFKKRTPGDKTDGCAIYYKQNVFELKNYTTVEFNQPGVPLLNRPNVAIVMRLHHRATNRDVIVANTHLLYNPKRWDIRLAQTQVLLAEFDRIMKTSSETQPACLLMGDFNSPPKSPAVTLLMQGQFQAEKRVLPDFLGITSSSSHKEKSKLYNSDRFLSDDVAAGSSHDREEGECSDEGSSGNRSPAYMYRKEYQPKLITHGFNFSSTYCLTDSSNRTEATTYQDKWLTVDYLFYSNLHLVSRLRLPTADECYAYIGPIPNRVSPSDHFPLVATYAL